MSTISLADLYAAPASQSNRGSTSRNQNAAADPTPLPTPTPSTTTTIAPAISWVAIIGTLFALRWLWEYAE